MEGDDESRSQVQQGQVQGHGNGSGGGDDNNQNSTSAPQDTPDSKIGNANANANETTTTTTITAAPATPAITPETTQEATTTVKKVQSTSTSASDNDDDRHEQHDEHSGPGKPESKPEGSGSGPSPAAPVPEKEEDASTLSATDRRRDAYQHEHQHEPQDGYRDDDEESRLELPPSQPRPKTPTTTTTTTNTTATHHHTNNNNNDSSFYEFTAFDPDERHTSSMTEEQQVMAHLQDVESSFVPPISPIPVAGPEGGVDDTYLFDVSPTKRDQPAHQPANGGNQDRRDASGNATATAQDQDQDQDQDDLQSARTTPKPTRVSSSAVDTQYLKPNTTTTPTATLPIHLRHDHNHSHSHSHNRNDVADTSIATSAATSSDAAEISKISNTSSSLENLTSSPSATAAAARTVSRAISMAASNRQSANARPDDSTSELLAALRHQTTTDHDTPRQSIETDNQPPQANPPTNNNNSSRNNHNNNNNNTHNSTRAPKFLRSRNASQRSSTSSFLTNDDVDVADVDSEPTVGLGADYALQSGGAAPVYGMTRSASNSLLRSISIGSMASGLDEYPDSSRVEPLEPLVENVRPGPNGEDEEDPAAAAHAAAAQTPKAKKQGPLLAPTDTVIARHVRNVEVPESLAKEYKTKGGLATPATPLPHHRKIPDYATYATPIPGTTNRNGRNMTLKEQSSTIERLSKENFDLKLKVMFLSDRLDKLSEEGIKEMISENVELKTSLAVIQRDNKVLRRRVKELEKTLRDRNEEERPSTARSGYSSDGRTTPPVFDEHAQEREEELQYLRERVEEYVTEIERLRNDNLSNHAEKRKLAEALKTMGERAGDRVGEGLGRQEEADVWKDLLEQETARREQADEDNRKLRDEIFRLKQGLGASGGSVTGQTGSGSGVGGMHHTTNIYNITRKARPSSPSRSRPVSGLSGEMDQGPLSQSSTLVEELRREGEQLRHENAELRREVGAQTSMLTSRNREKERLYQEIEDLKLAQRRGGPAPSTVDSLLERSASRTGNHERSNSRASGRTRLAMTVEEDPDREELENKLAEQRDKYNELKLKHQDIARELDACVQDYEAAMQEKQQAETRIAGLEEELENANNDAVALQTERDEALRDCEHLEEQFENLRQEAQDEIDILEAECDQKNEENQKLQVELQDRTENFEALQDEMRQMSEALVGLEDEQEKKHSRIQQLEEELGEANKELEELEAKLLESNDKGQRLSVQQESLQDEITFLREEQENDKVRIGNLEADLAAAEQSLREEQEHVKELEQRIDDERAQHEMVSNREKDEVQQFVNELNREASTAKDEVRRLRKSLTSREVEATEWKERLMEFENNLREALGDLNGTRSSFLRVRKAASISSRRCGRIDTELTSCYRISLISSGHWTRQCASSMRPRRRCSRKTASSSNGTPCSNRMGWNRGSWPTCWTRNGRPTATRRTNSTRSSGHTRTSPAR